jgi:tripartite-type tricarboxylate transporter receptor subunit TctC
MRRRAFIAGVMATAAVAGFEARADAVSDFYKGRQIEIIVGSSPGGGYDIYARLLAQHIARFMPGNPTAIVRNMPGAGGLRAANYLYQNAPKDGLAIAALAREIPTMGVLGGNPNVQYDVRKFNWLGSASSFSGDAYILWARKQSAAKTIDDLRRPGGSPLLIGATSSTSAAGTIPVLLHDALGLNLKVIPGYTDSGAVALAVDRGEVDGQFASFSVIHLEKPHWLDADSPVRPLVQYARATRHPLLADTPTARELAKDEHSRQLVEANEAPWAMSRPFAAPPGIPEDRAAALRQAFIAVQNDPGYLADAARAKVDTSPLDGASIVQLIDKLADAPPDIREYMRKQMQGAD